MAGRVSRCLLSTVISCCGQKSSPRPGTLSGIRHLAHDSAAERIQPSALAFLLSTNTSFHMVFAAPLLLSWLITADGRDCTNLYGNSRASLHAVNLELCFQTLFSVLHDTCYNGVAITGEAVLAGATPHSLAGVNWQPRHDAYATGPSAVHTTCHIQTQPSSNGTHAQAELL